MLRILVAALSLAGAAQAAWAEATLLNVSYDVTRGDERSALFHGRLHRGRAWIGDIEVDAPEHAEAEEQEAVAYVRPHDIEIERVASSDAALRARVSHVLSIGPSVRLELILESGAQRAPIQAEISKDRFRELKLVQGDNVFIRPRRFELFPNRIH